ncbi:MAG: LPS export ABC transporter periplasmic protein LptC [Candidatus Rokubacteria bacterium]|nr:LPS export ABC transporter periplasmic protein LptC [Candidatus Rokubacteria bacterium]
MHRLARIIPIVVAVFVIVVVAMLVTKSRTERVEPAAPDPAGADLRIKEVEIEEQSGSVRWRLKADQALVFESEGRTALRNIAVVVRDGEREWTIRAAEGDVVQRAGKRRDVEVRKDVVVTTSDGMRLETTVLRWNSEDQRLWTDAAVKLVRQGSVVEGKAFELRMADETATLTGRVRATFALGSRP